MSSVDGNGLPARIGVYGGGRMGSGIAHAFLANGCDVVVVEADEDYVRAARERIESSLTIAADRNALDEPVEDLMSRLVVTTGTGDLAECELIIEAVPEDIQLKLDVLGRISEVAPDAVVATNTSALSIGELASGLASPEDFLGLHFFNPVPVSSLVEIVVAESTRPDLPERAEHWVRAIGKIPIIVKDSPGFASSRLGVLLALEAMRMVEEGVASAADIDTAMTLGYKHPMGPLRTTDVVGLDVRLAIAQDLHRRLGDRFAPPRILEELVERGDLGRKSGRGFFTWDETR